MHYYKIIDLINGQPRFLMHGLGGTKDILKGKWLHCDKKWVSDGTKGTPYCSGFHVFDSVESARHYLQKFIKPHKAIAVVQCRGLRKKQHSPAVGLWLADSMMMEKVLGHET